METLRTRRFAPQLSGNALKILAAVSMTADHVGYILLPQVAVLRYIGRIAMPIFSFMIAEGCCHTRDRLRYFLHVLLLGAVCQTVYVVAMQDWLLCVPVSFAVAIPLVYLLQAWKKAMLSRKPGAAVVWGLAFWGAVAAVYVLTDRFMQLDYGFWGCMMPVAASLLRLPDSAPEKLRRLDCNAVHVLLLGVCMVMLALQWGAWQWWSLLALPLLLLYSGRRGKWRMKYFFYIFYPGHLALLEGLYMLLQWLG